AIDEGEVVEIALLHAGEVRRCEPSSGTIVDARWLRDGQVDEYEAETSIAGGADGQVTQLRQPPREQPARVGRRYETLPRVRDRLAECGAACLLVGNRRPPVREAQGSAEDAWIREAPPDDGRVVTEHSHAREDVGLRAPGRPLAVGKRQLEIVRGRG